MPGLAEELLNPLNGSLENIADRRDKNISYQGKILSRNLDRGLGPRIRDTHFVTDVLNIGINRRFICWRPGGGGVSACLRGGCFFFLCFLCFCPGRNGLRNVRLLRNDEETMASAAFGFLIRVDSGQPVFLAAFMAPENDFIL